MEIQLIDPRDLSAWTKNPRARDPERFEWIKVSLQKFGFVMPIYVRQEDGLLYSGHQRTGAAIELGFEKVPVVMIPDPQDDRVNRNLNILFNLCTNDHATRADFGKKTALALDNLEQFRSLPDAVNLYPCLDWFNIAPITFLRHLPVEQINGSTAAFAKALLKLGCEIPIILDENNQIINGGPRIAAAIEEKRLICPAVRVTNSPEAMRLFLNQITMSFDLKQAFGEELRYNSFFRSRNQGSQRKYLGVGFYCWVFGKEAKKQGKEWLFQHMIRLEGEFLTRFVNEHGTTCIDFGAGRLDNTRKLQASGLTCTPFEPYCLKGGTDDITIAGSRAIARSFLHWLARRPSVDSVFCSSVFNSVPFKEDRICLMLLFQALCLNGARLYLLTLSDDKLASVIFNNGVNAGSASMRAVLLDTEPGLYIGEIHRTAKVQKFHSKPELVSLGKQFFHKVSYCEANSSSHGIKCEQPKPIDWVEVVRAIEFEFDLPYPGGDRMGLVDQAIDAFSKFTGVDLHSIRSSGKPSETERQLLHPQSTHSTI